MGIEECSTASPSSLPWVVACIDTCRHINRAVQVALLMASMMLGSMALANCIETIPEHIVSDLIIIAEGLFLKFLIDQAGIKELAALRQLSPSPALLILIRLKSIEIHRII